MFSIAGATDEVAVENVVRDEDKRRRVSKLRRGKLKE
jgi:hypothetical protein